MLTCMNKSMSLTQFVSEPEIRDEISDTFPNQGERASSSVIAEWQTEGSNSMRK